MASRPASKPQPVSPTLMGGSRLLFPVSESLLWAKENHGQSQLYQKRNERSVSPSTTWFPPSTIPHHKLPSQPKGSSQVNGTPGSTDQAQMHIPLVVTDSQGTAQPFKESIVSVLRPPPPLIPFPKLEMPGLRHLRKVPQNTQASILVPHEASKPSLKTVPPHAPKPPCDTSLQRHYLDPSQPPVGQTTAVIAVRMQTTDPASNPVVLIPASISHRVHSTVPAIHQNQQPHQAATPQIPAHQPLVPPMVLARTGTVPSNAIWIVDGQQSSELPFAPVSQPSKPTLRQSALPPTTTPFSQHTPTSSKQEVPQDLSINSSSVIKQSTSIPVTSAVRQRVISPMPPVSSSCLSMLLTAGVPLVPVSSSEATTSVHSTTTTITRAPVVSTVPVSASMKEEDNSVISYVTKKNKAVKSGKQKYLEPDQALNGQVKRIKVIQKEVEDTLMPGVNSYTTQSCTFPIRKESVEDNLHISANTLPSLKPSTTPIMQPPMSVLQKVTASRDQPQVTSKANYVAVISITPHTTATTSAVQINTTPPTQTTTTPATQTTTSVSVTNELLVNFKTGKSHSEDMPNGTMASSTESTLAQKVNDQDSQGNSTKAPFILMPKKRLRILTDMSSTKGVPATVVKQLKEADQDVREGGALPRPSIIHTTTNDLKESQSKSSESGKSLEKHVGKEATSPPKIPTSSPLSSSKMVLLNLTSATALTTLGEHTKGEGDMSAAKTITTSPLKASYTSPRTKSKNNTLMSNYQHLMLIKN